MTLNTTCTIARCCEDENIVTWQGECMWQDVKGSVVKKYGEERADSAAIYIPDVSVDVEDGDMIIQGYYDADYTIINGQTVMNVTRCNYGSSVMQHIEIGIK